MCGGGGAAAKEAQAQEQMRQTQIAGTTDRVNQIFDSPSRQQGYQGFALALRKYLTDALTREKGNADRGLKFSLARSGNTGGSLAVDANKNLGDEFSRGVLDVERRVQGGVADLRSSDEAARLNLTQLAQTGVDTGTAASQAAAAMQTNLGKARGANVAEGLGDTFAATGRAVKAGADAAEKRKQTRYAELGLYS